MSKTKPAVPEWAGRAAESKIAQIYEDDKSGIHDEDLLNDIACILQTRRKSMLIVEEALTGRWKKYDHLGVTLMQTHPSTTMYRVAIGAAFGIAIVGALLLAWLSLGVGIIGKDGDPANLMYFGVIAVGILGAVLARLKPPGMARTMVAMALAQALVAAVALIAGLGLPYSGPLEILLLNGFFVALFAGSAWLFQRAAHARSNAGSA